MTLVRFKKQYSPDWDFNISYELVSDEIEYAYDEVAKRYDMCYNVKGLGYVVEEKLEITDDIKNIPAIEIFISLSNL